VLLQQSIEQVSIVTHVTSIL